MINLKKIILSNEELWCNIMGFKNPYLDDYKYHITSSVVTGDATAFNKYPENNFVYDKLFIAKTQNLKCGQLENINLNNISFPIFIKPRWGHLSAASKNCFKINNIYELNKYLNYDNMIWSEFIDGRESMTDFLLLNGKIVFQLTYLYSNEQNGFTDNWKYISINTKPSNNVVNWVNKNIKNHTGFVNVQSRNDKIIEVSLRPARSGAYLIAANNKAIMKNIHNVMDKNYYDYNLEKYYDFEPFYAFKCYLKTPIIFVLNQYCMDLIMNLSGSLPLYEYYFEPVNNEGVVFFQFMHTNFQIGLKIKKLIEVVFYFLQYFFLILFILSTYLIIIKNNYGIYIFMVTLLLFLTRFLNPLYTTFNNYKAYRQILFGKNSLTTPSTFIENHIKNNISEFE